MRPLTLIIFIILLLNGCTSGRFSVDEGRARFLIPFDFPQPEKKKLNSQLGSVYIGMPKADLYKVFAEFQQKDYRKQGNEEWITFSVKEIEKPTDMVTFYLLDGEVKQWQEK